MNKFNIFNILNRKYPALSSARGMTLLDMAIALLVIGLIAAPMIQTYKNWTASKSRGETFSSMVIANLAVEDFYYANDRYPCPADPALPTTNDNYGVENCALPVTDGVIIGSIPFVTLKIPDMATLDGWANRITYAVTQAQTVTPFNPDAGVITVQGYEQIGEDRCTDTLITHTNTGHYIFVSHGNNGVGTYTADGRPTAACPSGPQETRESANCIPDNFFFNQTCAKSTLDGPSYYDDLTLDVKVAPARIWEVSKANPDDIFSNAGNIGINNTNPLVSLDVMGNIRAQPDIISDPEKTGNSNARDVCTLDGTSCFSPQIIGGSDPAMDCNNTLTNNAMVGIARASALCQATYVEGVSGSCPAGQYMVGFKSGGEIICSP